MGRVSLYIFIASCVILLCYLFYLPTFHGELRYGRELSPGLKHELETQQRIQVEITDHHNDRRSDNYNNNHNTKDYRSRHRNDDNATMFEVVHVVYQYPSMPASAKERQREFADTLLRNIFQENVAGVHVLLEKETDLDTFYEYLERNTFSNPGKNSKEGDTNWDSEMHVKNFMRNVPDSLEGKKEMVKEKLRASVIGRWAQYKDLFQYASTHLAGEICVVSNADIFVQGEGWKQLRKHHLEENEEHNKTAYGLSRNELPCTKEWNKLCKSRGLGHSYDAFVFLSPLPQDFIDSCDHEQNRMGAENVVVYEFVRAGYIILNPCDTLSIWHNHCTGSKPGGYKSSMLGPKRMGVTCYSPTLYRHPALEAFIYYHPEHNFRNGKVYEGFCQEEMEAMELYKKKSKITQPGRSFRKRPLDD